MARAVKPARPQPQSPAGPDPYPEHRRLHRHMEANWQIREFVFWLKGRSVTDLSELSFDEINDLILEFRGVDLLAYRAEVAHMRSKYRWMWDRAKPGQVEPVEVFHESGRPSQARTLFDPPEGPDRFEEQSDPLQDLLSKVRKGRDASQD